MKLNIEFLPGGRRFPGRTVFAGCLVLLCASLAAGSAFVENERGVEALRAGRYDDAIACFLQAGQQAPDDATIRGNLATAYNNAAMHSASEKDFSRAYDLMQKAYRLEPASKAVKKNFALLITNECIRRYGEKTGEDLTGLLNEALRYDDTQAQTHVLLGQTYYDRDQYSWAKEEWEKALALDPSLGYLEKKLAKLKTEMTDENRLGEQQWRHFKVRYEGEVATDLARTVLFILEDAYADAGRQLGAYPDEPLTVVIYTQQRFTEVSGMPDWYAGVYDGKIRIRRSDVEGDSRRLKQILCHEYVHALVHYLAGNNVPVWLNEGIAQCYETLPDKPALNTAEQSAIAQRLGSGLPDTAAIEKDLTARSSQDDVRFAYIYAKAFVSYLIERGWDSNIKRLLEELKQGTAVDDAFRTVYFRSLEQMRDDWQYALQHPSAF